MREEVDPDVRLFFDGGTALTVRGILRLNERDDT